MIASEICIYRYVFTGKRKSFKAAFIQHSHGMTVVRDAIGYMLETWKGHTYPFFKRLVQYWLNL